MRISYSAISSMPAWLLLNEDKTKTIASVRAPDESEARKIFTMFNLTGTWLRKIEV